MNEKSIRAPFVPDKRKFCGSAKAAGGNLPNKYSAKLYKSAHENGAPERQRRSGALKSFSREGMYVKKWIGKLCRVSQSIFSHTSPLVKMISAHRNAAGVPVLHFHGQIYTILPSIYWANCRRRLSQSHKISAYPAQKGRECFFRS